MNLTDSKILIVIVIFTQSVDETDFVGLLQVHFMMCSDFLKEAAICLFYIFGGKLNSRPKINQEVTRNGKRVGNMCILCTCYLLC